MPKLPAIDPLTYLVQRKFPGWTRFLPPSLHERPSASSFNEKLYQERRKDADAYYKHLQSLSPTEVQQLYSEEKLKEQAEWWLKAKHDEEARFFNQPSANADLNHWSKAALWTLGEAVALSQGKEPGVVNWSTVEPYVGRSPFAHLYQRTRELVMRARQAQVLSEPVAPAKFIQWAIKSEVHVPEALVNLVRERSEQWTDWKTIYLQHKADAEKQFAAWSQAFADQAQIHKDELAAMLAKLAEQERAVSQLHVERDMLQAKVAHTERDAKAPQARDRTAATKEKQSLLKLLIGFAVGGYGYDPAEKKTDTINDMQSDLDKHGISMHPDTIRKYLREAAEFLPRGIPAD